MQALRDRLIRELQKILKDIKTDNSELTDSEAMEIMRVLSHKAMSKTIACEYLNIKGSTFDTFVRQGKLPRGRKRTGFKELCWYKDELDECIKRIRHGNI